MKILNTWKSNHTHKYFFDLNENQNVCEYGDFSVFKLADSYLYCYKEIAINQLVGLNEVYVGYLANCRKPQGNMRFVFERAVNALKKGFMLIPDKNNNGVEMELITEKQSIKQTNGVVISSMCYYRCLETGEKFTNEDLNVLNSLILNLENN